MAKETVTAGVGETLGVGSVEDEAGRLSAAKADAEKIVSSSKIENKKSALRPSVLLILRLVRW